MPDLSTRVASKGMSVIGLVLGVAFLAVIVVLAFAFAMLVLTSQGASNEPYQSERNIQSEKTVDIRREYPHTPGTNGSRNSGGQATPQFA